MKYIEVSKKIKLSGDVSEEQIRHSLLARMRRAFVLDRLDDQPSSISVSATTGGPGRMLRYARLDLNITVTKTKDAVRVIMYGYTQVAKSLLVSYSFLFLLVLLAGLLPGSLESGEDSGPLDAIVFVIFGIFIFYDINKHLTEAKEHLQAVLDSLDTEFG